MMLTPEARASLGLMSPDAMPLTGESRAMTLQQLGIESVDWARLPSELRSEILQAARQSGPKEYRELIKRYFRQVAKRGGAKSSGDQP